ncbi:hypothetical protein AAUPMG_12636, partial [Pasteurella multocida subsp. multocida str. Anand1_goat]
NLAMAPAMPSSENHTLTKEDIKKLFMILQFQ